MQVYLDFYGLKKPPFSVTPDPKFLFFSDTHKDVIDRIIYGINNRMGFILLIGEVGTGKTTICRAILDILNDNAETVYIINPSLTSTELISSILDDLNIHYPPGSTKKELITRLNKFLLAVATKKPVVMIIDDAQTMPIEALEDLRLLSNLETDKEKLIQIVLAGQPELMELLSRTELRQIKQRIAVICRLGYLKRYEMEGYINRRLFIAGNSGNLKFTSRAINRIYSVSKGVPRLINRICDYSLIAGYVSNDFIIKQSHVKRALKELKELDVEIEPSEKTELKFIRPLTKYLLSALVFVLFFAITTYLYNKHNEPSNRTLLKKGEVIHRKIQNVKIEDSDLNPQIVHLKQGEKEAPISSYTILLGSFKSLDSTLKAVKNFNEMGIDAHWNRVDIGDGSEWYRVFFGKFKTKEEAELFKKDNQLTHSIVISAPWTVIIDEGESEERLAEIINKLREKEFDPYIVEYNGFKRIAVGVFVTYNGAQVLASKIKELGFKARVVQR